MDKLIKVVKEEPKSGKKIEFNGSLAEYASEYLMDTLTDKHGDDEDKDEVILIYAVDTDEEVGEVNKEHRVITALAVPDREVVGLESSTAFSEIQKLVLWAQTRDIPIYRLPGEQT